MAEFFREERLEAPPGIDWGTDPGNGGSGGGGWPGIGGGWPGIGGGGWWYWWGSGSGGENGPGYAWDGGDPINQPRLKHNTGGRLLRDASCRLLLGTLSCRQPPTLELYLAGDPERKHSDCVLLRLSDARPMSVALNPKEHPAAALVYWPWAQPGTFILSAKWQDGHYDIAAISRVRVVAYGVDTGWRPLLLGRYVDMVRIVITDDYCVYVNDILGKMR